MGVLKRMAAEAERVSRPGSFRPQRGNAMIQGDVQFTENTEKQLLQYALELRHKVLREAVRKSGYGRP